MKAFINLLLSVCLVTPNYQNNKFQNLITFVSKNYRLPDKFRDDCNWYYAIVNCELDQNNKIINYKLLNEAPKELYKSFSFLKSYTFPKIDNVKNHSVVFCLTIENKKENCKIERNVFYTPSEITAQIYYQISQQISKRPKTFLLDQVIVIPVYDTIN